MSDPPATPEDMEGSAAYARSYLKADLRNTWTLLRLLEEDVEAELDPDSAREAAAEVRQAAIALRQLERLVHDVTVGLRESGDDDVDLDALRRFVDSEASEAGRQRRIANDTLEQWSRSFERVLPWWETLPVAETLLDDARWPAPIGGELEVELTADERFRVLRVDRTRDQLRAHFENYLSKYPVARVARLMSDGDVVATITLHAGAVRFS